MHPKDADGIANSADPDQTAPLILVSTVCPNLSVRKLRSIAVDYAAIFGGAKIFQIFMVLA